MTVTDYQPEPTSSSAGDVPAGFAKLVRDALGHLYDTTYLQRHDLLRYLVPLDLSDPRARAQYLREAIMRAIADLRPPSGGSPRSPAFRPYAIMRYRFCDDVASVDIQEKLAIGRRQFFREQQRAIETVVSHLWERRVSAPPSDGSGQALSDELTELGLQSEMLDLETLTEQAMGAVAGLSAKRGVAFSLESGRRPQAFADGTVTRQLLISFLEALVESAAGRYLTLRLDYDGRWTTLSCRGLPEDTDRAALEGTVLTPMRLAARMGGELEVASEDDGTYLCLRLPSAREDVVAIVDDNQRTLHLLKRYLEPYRYRPVLIGDSTRAFAEILELQPDVVILDIMMRDVDGWQILQAVRTDPRTRAIPVIICSVLNSHQLASTIGADHYLRKPVSQAELVLALAHVRQVSGSERAAPEARSPASA